MWYSIGLLAGRGQKLGKITSAWRYRFKCVEPEAPRSRLDLLASIDVQMYIFVDPVIR